MALDGRLGSYREVSHEVKLCEPFTLVGPSSKQGASSLATSRILNGTRMCKYRH